MRLGFAAGQQLTAGHCMVAEVGSVRALVDGDMAKDLG